MLRVRDVIIIALLTTVVILIARIIWGTPFVKRVVSEAFASGSGSSGGPVNTITECPAGATLYMYEGTAYCCSSTINPDADSAAQTCLVVPGQDTTFCTLGPTSQTGVKNCMELKSGLLAAEGASVCPSSSPNFAKGPRGSPTENGRCCAGNVNKDATDCESSSPAGFCDVNTDPNVFKDPRSCGYLKAKEDDDECASGFSAFDMAGHGTLNGLTVYGCTNMSTSCYSQAMVNRLTELGYDVKGIPICGAS